MESCYFSDTVKRRSSSVLCVLCIYVQENDWMGMMVCRTKTPVWIPIGVFPQDWEMYRKNSATIITTTEPVTQY